MSYIQIQVKTALFSKSFSVLVSQYVLENVPWNTLIFFSPIHGPKKYIFSNMFNAQNIEMNASDQLPGTRLISQRCHCTVEQSRQEKGLYQSEHIGLFQARRGVLSVIGVTAQWNSPNKKRGYISQSTLEQSKQHLVMSLHSQWKRSVVRFQVLEVKPRAL